MEQIILLILEQNRTEYCLLLQEMNSGNIGNVFRTNITVL